MILKTALTRTLIVPLFTSRAFPSQKQVILCAVRSVSNFPFFAFHPNPYPRSSGKSLYSPSEVFSCSATKQPLVLTAAVVRLSMSDSGHSDGADEAQFVAQTDKSLEAESRETDANSLESNNTAKDLEKLQEGQHMVMETVNDATSDVSKKQSQMIAYSGPVIEKEMEAKSLHEEKIDTDGGGLSQQMRSSTAQAKHPQVSEMSKRAQKKLLRKQKFKDQRKAKRAGNFTNNSSPGFDSDLFTQTDYYFENGLRKVYPYHFTFSTYAKERWYGRTLQDIFEKEFRVDSPDNFRTSVSKGFMKVNGQVACLDHVIKNGDLIEHLIHRHENPVSGQPIEVVADTEDVVVINKPPSIPCHPCGKFRFNSIVFIMGKELGYANLRNIYRLDRLTSGVLIMGKTAKKTKQLENHILHRQVQKEYLARVVGEFPPEEVTVDKPLDCMSYKMTLWHVVDKGGKPSRTTFQRLSYNGQTSLVKCLPHTGRTHQIRVHLQYLGHPIMNDPYYNSPAWGPLRGKGGNFDIPMEELVKRIMQEHNVGMWIDGENPLYQQRMTDAACTAGSSSPEASSTGDTEQGATCLTIPATTSRESEELTPPAKKARLDISDSSSSLPPKASLAEDAGASLAAPAEHPVSSTCTAPSAAGQTVKTNSPTTGCGLGTEAVIKPSVEASSTDSTSVLTNANSSTDSSNLENAAVFTKSANSDDIPSSANSSNQESAAVLANANSSGLQSAAVSKEDFASASGGVERRGFDPERWTPDPHCESCRLNYVDPKPSDLLLYLHALRYQGPGWDYSTKMPAWAADDWQEPQEYDKYLK